MKFTCLQENLLKGLNIVSKAVPLKGPLPILTNILVTAKDGRIKLSATNLETTISIYVGGSVDIEGIVTVPAKVFRDFVSNLSTEKVSLELDKDILKVDGGKSKAKINGMVADDYPPLPEFVEDVSVLKFNASELASAVGMVAFAASLDETKPLYSGILFDYSSVNKSLTMTSTNGFRLSEKVLPIDSDYESFSAVLPAKTVMEVSRIFSGAEEPLIFVLNNSENMALFQSNNTLVATRLIAGDYPDYKRIIPTSKVVTVELESAHLLEAAKLAGIFARNEEDSILIVINPETNQLSLKSVSQEMGNHQSDIEAVVDGEYLEIAFKPKYLLDLLNNVKADRLLIESSGVVNPFVVKPLGDSSFLHLMMPLRING